ncbi:hypothetical protein SAMN05421741_11376 [Paenimyroides ummariense]|uniref:NVEALA protein n=1 Tax=Paenimyroides ummariense TaxID=913024 RepID=A0A1I5CVA8_9FLAO|nr:DUF6520 family protein [Paenimyroides ummariense]SFN90892.1 hypothetical protein SAMN05421741_11376 [Paenimyroides ummariense]
MKTNFKRAIMPFAVVVLGAAAAFATNAAKQNQKADEAAMFGYHYVASNPVGNRCVAEWVPCNTEGGPVCTIAGKTYYRIPTVNGLQCTSQLFLD